MRGNRAAALLWSYSFLVSLPPWHMSTHGGHKAFAGSSGKGWEGFVEKWSQRTQTRSACTALVMAAGDAMPGSATGVLRSDRCVWLARRMASHSSSYSNVGGPLEAAVVSLDPGTSTS